MVSKIWRFFRATHSACVVLDHSHAPLLVLGVLTGWRGGLRMWQDPMHLREAAADIPLQFLMWFVVFPSVFLIFRDDQ